MTCLSCSCACGGLEAGGEEEVVFGCRVDARSVGGRTEEEGVGTFFWESLLLLNIRRDRTLSGWIRLRLLWRQFILPMGPVPDRLKFSFGLKRKKEKHWKNTYIFKTSVVVYALFS